MVKDVVGSGGVKRSDGASRSGLKCLTLDGCIALLQRVYTIHYIWCFYFRKSWKIDVGDWKNDALWLKVVFGDFGVIIC